MKKKLTLNKIDAADFICLLTGKYQQAVMLFIAIRIQGSGFRAQQ
ncbi:hypothetical protein [Xenorhabdus kozodoii]|nr:hypothetical protein [Xenorhabdus kozodoii]